MPPIITTLLILIADLRRFASLSDLPDPPKNPSIISTNFARELFSRFLHTDFFFSSRARLTMKTTFPTPKAEAARNKNKKKHNFSHEAQHKNKIFQSLFSRWEEKSCRHKELTRRRSGSSVFVVFSTDYIFFCCYKFVFGPKSSSKTKTKKTFAFSADNTHRKSFNFWRKIAIFKPQSALVRWCSHRNCSTSALPQFSLS